MPDEGPDVEVVKGEVEEETPEVDAALKEGEGKRTVTVRGTEFELPDEIPFKVFLAMKVGKRAQRTKDDQLAFEAAVDMAEAYIGEEKYAQFVHGLSVEEGAGATAELVRACDAEYGTEPGESSASQDS